MVSVPGQADPPPQTVSVTVDPAPMAVSVDVDNTDWATICRFVGWPEAEIDNVCAVSLAEAGNADHTAVYADAIGDLTLIGPMWHGSGGPLQVRALRNPETGAQSFDRWRVFPALLNPYYNAWVGLQIFNALGWGAWSTFNDGSYKQYLGLRPKVITGHSTAPNWWK